MHILKTDVFSESLREKFRFTRRVIPALMMWLLMAFAAAAIGWGTFFSLERTALKTAEARALRDTASFARSHADRLKRSVDAVDQMMRHVQLEWELSVGKLQVENLRKYGLFHSTDTSYVIIFNRDGKPVLTTLPTLPIISAAERPYFLAQKSAGTDSMYINRPSRGLASGINVIQFSRRLVDATGAFDGVVVVSVAATRFTANYDTSVLGSGGLLGFVSKDQTVMVTRIGTIVSSPDTPKLFSNPPFAPSHGSAFLDGKLFGDTRSRYVGWEQVPGYSLTAFAGLNGEEALANYQSQYDSAMQNVLWATLGLALLTMTAMVLTVEMAWRKHRLNLTHATYRLATEEASEGFYIVQPVSDKQGVVTDFRVIDCNEQGAGFLDLRKSDLIGKDVSLFKKRVDTEPFIKCLKRALDEGMYESEIDVPEGSPLRLNWVHVKIIRSGGNLAVRLRDISEAKAHVSELRRRGNEDVLTSLPNRHWIQGYLPEAIQHAEKAQESLALLFIDLDGFKKVNDTAGHAAGDELLQHAAQRLQEAIRPHDKVVRFGGDEFVVIVENIEHRIDAAHVAERVQYAFGQPFRLGQDTHSVGTSIGIALFPTDAQDASTLLERADIAMYSVKMNGKHGYQFYESKFYSALRERLDQEAELRKAVARDEFIMYYQPRVDIVTGLTLSLEALVRWQHPWKGLLEPREFIAIAEESGLIVGIGELVIDKVCAQLASWAKRGTELVPVSINVSPRQFGNADVVDLLVSALVRHNVPARLVELEITESSVMAEGGTVSMMLASLQEKGVKILVDDFGTGYSSLSQLQRLDFDVLKVDQSFTAALDKSEESKVFFTAIVTMAHALGMRVVAEGVETLSQIKTLKSLHCDEIQGFYISKPLPPGEEQPILPKWFFPIT